MDKQSLKAQYESPEIHDHGDVRKITLQGTATNADTNAGIANTAFPIDS